MPRWWWCAHWSLKGRRMLLGAGWWTLNGRGTMQWVRVDSKVGKSVPWTR